MLDRILMNYGVRIEHDQLITEATEKNFAQKN